MGDECLPSSWADRLQVSMVSLAIAWDLKVAIGFSDCIFELMFTVLVNNTAKR